MARNFNDFSVASQASNLMHGDNPPFTLSDFYKMYPQFEGKLDNEIIQMYIDFADSCVDERRWGTAWKLGMCYFIAHFCSIHLQGTLSAESSAGQVLGVAQSKGLISSKSAGDVSVSYDFGTIMDDLDGWAQWKLTSYGIQFASLGKLMGKGAVYIW